MEALNELDNETYNYIMDKKFCEYGMSCLVLFLMINQYYYYFINNRGEKWKYR